MECSQRYIGTPDGLVVCIDRKGTGRFYHFYSRRGYEFRSLDELVFEMEQFYDGINFPYPGSQRRGFTKTIDPVHSKKERKKVMGEEELLRQHGDLGTFIVRVQHRQNSSWQGRVTWSDKNVTVNFRSVWELVRLMEDAMNAMCGREEDGQEARWPEE